MDPIIVRDDITTIEVDSIVLPANPELKEGSGASTNIYKKAGRKQLKEACKRYKRIETGNSVPTLGFNLPATYIIHSVVPSWHDGEHNEEVLLCAAYISALELADRMGCTSIAFPLLAAGNNGFELPVAMATALKSIKSYEPTNKLRNAFLVLYGLKATSYARESGLHIEERIDQKYVLEHRRDQELRNDFDLAADWAKGIVSGFAGDAFTMLDEYLNDPETRKQIIEKAAKAAIEVAKATAKSLPATLQS